MSLRACHTLTLQKLLQRTVFFKPPNSQNLDSLPQSVGAANSRIPTLIGLGTTLPSLMRRRRQGRLLALRRHRRTHGIVKVHSERPCNLWVWGDQYLQT
jgi:hypothetical protein